MTNFAISWSRLECAEQCPLQCYWKNFAPKDQRVPFDSDNPHLTKGKLWHFWMENQLKGGTAVLDKDLTKHRAAWKELRDNPPENLSRFKPMLEAIRREPGHTYVEEQVTLTENYQKCGWFAKAAYWRTIYDLLKVRPDGSAISLDWKTGKVKARTTDQLRFSSAAAFLRYPEIQKIKTAYVWLEHDVPPTSVEYTRKELPGIMEEFEERVEVVKIMAEDNSWEPKPSDFNCKWCPCTPAQCKHSRN